MSARRAPAVSRRPATLLRPLAAMLLCAWGSAWAVSDVVVSQVYGGGGNTGAPLRNDFIELFNRGSAPVSLAGWSVQYASAAGSTWQKTDLGGVLQPGQYLLVQQAAGANAAAPALPAPDFSGAIAMSATAGKVALVRSANLLTCGAAAGNCLPNADIADLVGFGAANNAESTPTPALSNTTAALRANGGCLDSDSNATDFAVAAPAPRNSAAPLNACGAPANQPVVPNCPSALSTVAGTPASALLGAADADGRVITAVLAAGAPAGVALGVLAPAAGIGASAAVELSVSAAAPVGTQAVTVQFANDDASPQTASCTVQVTVTGTPAAGTRIRDIQGRGHLSPRNGQAVSGVPGIVTAVRSNGFYLQDPNPDADDATSEGLFVFTSSAPAVAVGDSVIVGGTVSEFRPGGTGGTGNLTITEIVTPTVALVGSGNPLPAPVVIGRGGRVAPTLVIDDDASGSVETSGSFDPASDGIDFYESLEGMRVRIDNAVAAGPTNSFGEIPVLADFGLDAATRSARGGVVISATDFNPERVLLDDAIRALPALDVGDSLPLVVGVMDYSFGNFKLLVSDPVSVTPGNLRPETTQAQGADELAIASFNVENLDPGDPQAKFDTLAAQIVNNLRAPDIVAVMEMQDDNGAVNDAVVSAATTFGRLIAAIQAAGGPAYQFRQINPVDDQDGGEPGGNIRVGFLFNPLRVAFTDRAGGTPTAATAVVGGAGGPQLSFSPGRIDPANPAFNASRKPLAGEFRFNGNRLFVIANHFNSKGGDEPLFGHSQPPQRSSEVQRGQQAGVVAGFVQAITALDANARVVVLGDLNDFEFSPALATLKAAGLHDLVETLPPAERYTYVFEGNSQVLDHILVSGSLASGAHYDVVHINSEFALQASDHDPEVARLALPLAIPDVTAQVQTSISGLTFNRRTGLYSGTISVRNAGAVPIAGPLQVELDGLTAGVALTNASGFRNGAPYLTSAGALAPGASVPLPVRFANPSRAAIGYTLRVLSGAL